MRREEEEDILSVFGREFEQLLLDELGEGGHQAGVGRPSIDKA